MFCINYQNPVKPVSLKRRHFTGTIFLPKKRKKERKPASAVPWQLLHSSPSHNAGLKLLQGNQQSLTRISSILFVFTSSKEEVKINLLYKFRNGYGLHS